MPRLVRGALLVGKVHIRNSGSVAQLEEQHQRRKPLVPGAVDLQGSGFPFAVGRDYPTIATTKELRGVCRNAAIPQVEACGWPLANPFLRRLYGQPMR